MSQTHVQLPLLSGMPALEVGGKDEALKRVEANANPNWNEFAYQCVAQVAATKPEFTSDDVDDLIESFNAPERPTTHEKRALGPVMCRGKREGLMQPTNQLAPSTRRKLHNSPRRVWRSLIFRGKLAA